jgi:hypothetical protein
LYCGALDLLLLLLLDLLDLLLDLLLDRLDLLLDAIICCCCSIVLEHRIQNQRRIKQIARSGVVQQNHLHVNVTSELSPTITGIMFELATPNTLALL